MERGQVLESAIDYFKGDDLAAGVWTNKYALKDEDNFLESSPDEMHKRLAKEFARIEKTYDKAFSESVIYDSLKDFKYIVPGGSAMYGIGNDKQITSIANCFVLESPEDSYGGIMKTDEELVQIMKRRGGVGIDISNIRPANTKINNAAGLSDGLTLFMERYSNTTLEVAQNGRRGALMLCIDCSHIDIEKFILYKQDLEKCRGANISIKFSDDFMSAVENNLTFELQYPVGVPIEEATHTKVVKAKDIWDMFVHSNWKGAEPGCFFWDTMQNSLSDCYEGYETIATNPCLVGNTKITTSLGNIEIINLCNMDLSNVKVLTYNTETKITEWEEIVDCFKTKDNANIIELELEDGENIELTPDHKVYTENRGYINASDLEEDDILISI